MQILKVNHIENHNDFRKQIHSYNKFIISVKTYVRTLVNFDVFSAKFVYTLQYRAKKSHANTCDFTCENY